MRISRTLTVALLFATGGAASVSWGYGGDTHYYLRIATALETCFDWDESHLIASADYLVDKNRTTTSEKHPFKQYNKINWHAFGHDEARFNALWERVLTEQDVQLKLVKLGQFLHFVSDWEPHAGYGIKMGHGLPTIFGKDPDSLGNNRANNLRMIQQTIDHMMKVCIELGRVPQDDPDRAMAELYLSMIDEPLMDELFATNSPKWKTFGKRGKKARQILAHNHYVVEDLIERRSKPLDDKRVPEDFVAGDPEHGIPPPIGLRYDPDGTLIEILGVEVELMPEYNGSDLSAVEEEAFEEAADPEFLDDFIERTQDEDDPDLTSNLELEVIGAKLEKDGWTVRVRIENLGDGPSSAGQLEIVVIDVVTEELLGETTWDVDALLAEDSIKKSFRVLADGEPTKQVMIGVSLLIDDLSADNNDTWSAPWVDRAQVGKPKKKRQEPAPVELLGPTKMWVEEHGISIIVLTAYALGGDTSHRLETLDLSFVGPGGELALAINPEEEVVWSSTPDLKRQVVPAKTLAWFENDRLLCDTLEERRFDLDRLRVAVGGSDVVSSTRDYPLDPSFMTELSAACKELAP